MINQQAHSITLFQIGDETPWRFCCGYGTSPEAATGACDDAGNVDNKVSELLHGGTIALSFDRQGAIDVLLDELAEAGELASLSSWFDDHLARNLAEIASFVSEATRLEAVPGRDYDGLEADLRELSTSVHHAAFRRKRSLPLPRQRRHRQVPAPRFEGTWLHCRCTAEIEK